MGSMFGALNSAAQSLHVIERAIDVVQNNVANSSTPGYARQTQTILANAFDPAHGVPGGISAGAMVSARSNFAEDAVRSRQSSLGNASQKASDLAQVEQIFTVADGSGINGALGALFSSFSQLTVSPNDSTSRQVVLDRAQALAGAINAASNSLGASASSVNAQAKGAVAHINKLAADIAGLNSTLRTNIDATHDAGLDTQLNNDLEELSKVANYTALHQPDGSVSVYLGGQTPLVVGDRQYQIDAGFLNGGIQITNSDGVDITKQITGGLMSGMLEEKNTLLPAYQDDLNTLARSIAGRVNTVLRGGVDKLGTAPTTDLFTYDPVLGAAGTLKTNKLNTDQLAAALPSAAGGNGNALNLSALSSSKEIDGYSFSEYYGDVASKVGRGLSDAQSGRRTQQQLLDQSSAIREQVSGVNLNEEAAHLVELQRKYQAAAKMLSVLSDLTQTVIGLVK